MSIGRPAWNGSGFGSNDPGRQRDRTAITSRAFDSLYPVDIDRLLGAGALRAHEPANVLLGRLAGALPFTLRVDRDPAAIAELRDARVDDLREPVTLRAVLEEICSDLPPGWQATRLAGRVILYRERVDDYPSAEIIARS